jgi:hypothetical protein
MLKDSANFRNRQGITYFEFSEIIVDSDGLNIRSRSVSIKLLGPTS